MLDRSMFAGAGKYAGHWTGDNWSRYDHLKAAVIGVIEMNLFGIPYSGSTICGFNGDAADELCLRWMQLGAFHPFARYIQLLHS